MHLTNQFSLALPPSFLSLIATKKKNSHCHELNQMMNSANNLIELEVNSTFRSQAFEWKCHINWPLTMVLQKTQLNCNRLLTHQNCKKMNVCVALRFQVCADFTYDNLELINYDMKNCNCNRKRVVQKSYIRASNSNSTEINYYAISSPCHGETLSLYLFSRLQRYIIHWTHKRKFAE